MAYNNPFIYLQRFEGTFCNLDIFHIWKIMFMIYRALQIDVNHLRVQRYAKLLSIHAECISYFDTFS